ncbi:aldehyde dehydrogenase family protein [Lachnospiraceae bacterium LCP25S3_G4]
MILDSKEVELIVQQVLKNIDLSKIHNDAGSVENADSSSGNYGVYEKVEDAIHAAYEAQKRYLNSCTVEDRNRIIEAIRKVSREHVEEFARMIVDESGMGRYEDKVEKNLAVINNTPGTECLTTNAISGDAGLMLEEYAPFGLIGAITPVTNPTETIINNTISMIAGGNSVIFNVHPSAKKVCAYCLQLLNRTIVENGGPQDLITMTKEPTMENVEKISQSPKVRLMVGTGGMPMVNALLRSGKKTIGAGAGNPPVVVDDTADIELAAKEIYRGASFDNNLLCLAEKEVFVMEAVASQLVNRMVEEGAYLLNPKELEQITTLVLLNDEKGYRVNKKWVGKDASKMLEQIGVHKPEVRLLLCETPADHPFVLVEQLMPILPIVRCKSFDEAVQGAYVAETGNRHTASMFSKNVDNMTKFARKIETTIFVKNGATLKGVGIGGNGYATMTIAGPTGEGITCAKSFTRNRRCMLADGGFRIV